VSGALVEECELREVMRKRQRGGAMLVTLVIITSLLAGASVLVSTQLASTRSTELTGTGISSTYCAEAGLTTAAAVVAAQYPNWAGSLLSCGAGPYPCAEPPWLYTAVGSHDLDGDGVDDFALYIRDDDDELLGVNDRTTDMNLRVYVVARCLKYPDNPHEITELVQMGGGGAIYDAQQGGFNGNGNAN
jgi:hypothetical protein